MIIEMERVKQLVPEQIMGGASFEVHTSSWLIITEQLRWRVTGWLFSV